MRIVGYAESKSHLATKLETPHVLALDMSIPVSSLCFFLYEANGWIGEFSDRILHIQEFAFHQPSLDAMWPLLFSERINGENDGITLNFEKNRYEELDQIAETAAATRETQLLIGWLTVAIVGNSHAYLYSTETNNLVEFCEDRMIWRSFEPGELDSARRLCEKYGYV